MGFQNIIEPDLISPKIEPKSPIGDIIAALPTSPGLKRVSPWSEMMARAPVGAPLCQSPLHAVTHHDPFLVLGYSLKLSPGLGLYP